MSYSSHLHNTKGNYQLTLEQNIVIATCQAISFSLQIKIPGSMLDGVKMPMDTDTTEYEGQLSAPQNICRSSTSIDIALFALTKFVGGWTVLNELYNASRPYASMLIENIIRTELKMPILTKPRTAFNESV